MRTRFVGIGFLFLLSIVGLAPSAHAFDIPPNDGYYTQTFDVITPEQETQIETMLDAYRKQTSNEIAILMVDSLKGDDIASAAVEVGRKWKVGSAENDNGVLILAALEDRQITIQVGYGLEGVLPDIVVKGIIDQEITPHFTEADYYNGLIAGITAIEKHIGGEYKADRYNETAGFGFSQFGFFLVIMALHFLGALFARSKSWWLGGVIGGVIGIVLTVLWSFWLAIPLFIVLGLLFDFIVSRMPKNTRRGGRYWGGGGGFGGGSGGGGFGGFGGGSFGGGGASGKW